MPFQRRSRSIDIDYDPSHSTANAPNDDENNIIIETTTNNVTPNTPTSNAAAAETTTRATNGRQSMATSTQSSLCLSPTTDTIDPLMGSMEFEESQPSFNDNDCDENGVVVEMQPGMIPKNTARNGNTGHGVVGDDNSIGIHSSSSSSSSSSVEGSTKQRNKEQELSIGEKETLALHRIRSIILMILFLIALIGSIMMGTISVHNEIQSFEHDFQSMAHAIQRHVQQTKLQYQHLQSFDILSNDISTLAMHHQNHHQNHQIHDLDNDANVTSSPQQQQHEEEEDEDGVVWPYVTLSQSSLILERFLSLTDTEILTIYPIIAPSNQQQWEEYSISQQSWIDDDLHNTMISLDSRNETTTTESESHAHAHMRYMSNVFHDDSSFATTGTTSSSIPPYIHDINNVPLNNNVTGTPSTTPYAIWWQYAPILSDRSIINLNAMTPTIEAMLLLSEMEQQPVATISPIQYYKETKKKKKKSTRSKNNDYTVDNHDDDDMENSTATTTTTTTTTSSSATAADTIDMILRKQSATYTSGDPYSYIYYPIFEEPRLLTGEDGDSHNTSTTQNIVAILSATVLWKSYFENAVPESHGIICVINSTLDGDVMTFDLDADHNIVEFLGYYDGHDPTFDDLVVSFPFSLDDSMTEYTGVPFSHNIASYTIHIYPSRFMKDSYTTKTPIIVSSVMILSFFLMLVAFCMYDGVVSKRQKIVMNNAYKTYNIVSSLFPATVRDRMIQDATVSNHNDSATALGRSSTLQQLLHTGSSHSHKATSAIADFYPSATVLFSDITGFTAWCAEREPSQVFVLLEAIYSAYDSIAKKRKVFKVETIGDCYMAVVGVPEPRSDHAIVMCRFARQCLTVLRGILNELEMTLGPGTADLNMRFGLHSGPVTAGVLRVSQNARFQLFGDTVNTAARMESNGSPGMIHLSEETANELAAHGKHTWFYPRSEKITAKGKGELQTYWLDLSASSIVDRMSVSTSSMYSSLSMKQEKKERCLKRMIGGQEIILSCVQSCRLVDWILDTLNPMLCRIVSRRIIIDSQTKGQQLSSNNLGSRNEAGNSYGSNIMNDALSADPPTFEEVIDPNCNATIDVQPLDTKVSEQLHDFVHMIASRYRNDNPYHNFEHAAFTMMSIVSFMNRITITSTPKSWLLSDYDVVEDEFNPTTTAAQQTTTVTHIRRILNDPITLFACVLAGLVHDVDHSGRPKLASSSSSSSSSLPFKQQQQQQQQQISSEQTALHVAWSILNQSDFTLLRHAMFGSANSNSNESHDSDYNRFRYIFVHAVIATDQCVAHNRNEGQYQNNKNVDDDKLSTTMSSLLHNDHMNDNTLDETKVGVRDTTPLQRAITFIEHMMQISDIGHMIQQWPIYMKWNERLLQEYMHFYTSNVNGDADMGKPTASSSLSSSKKRNSSIGSALNHSLFQKQQQQHPTTYWYENEKRYIKQYVIPLTEQIRDELDYILSDQSVLPLAVVSSSPDNDNDDNDNDNSNNDDMIATNTKKSRVISPITNPTTINSNSKHNHNYFIASTQLYNEWTLRGPVIIDEMIVQQSQQSYL